MKPVSAPSHRKALQRLLKKAAFRWGYEEELAKLRVVDALVVLRKRQRLTQHALAKRLGVTQPLIAKLERAETHNFTLDTLIRMVKALNGELVIHVKPRSLRISHPA